jgi:cell division protein FtsB|tara:strand:- start:129 stop:425 length:297 start_codon:yes stop_codon:yes gene_type:complete
MVTKKLLTLTILSVVFIAVIYLFIQLNRAYDEFSHWQSREAVLEKELDDLRIEANDHRQFLDKLRRDPDFQDAVARKELGYGKNEERLYRFPSKDIID